MKRSVVLWIAGQGGQLECVLQSQLQAEKLEIVEKLDGFAVVHGSARLVQSLKFKV